MVEGPEGMCLLPHITAAENLSPACQQLVDMPRIPPPGSDGHKYFGQTLLTQSCPTASPKSLEDKDKLQSWKRRMGSQSRAPAP